jgi:hypothetical protein
VRAGTRNIKRSIVAVPSVRYGCAPLPKGHGFLPRFVAVVRMAGGKQYVAIPVGPSLIGNRVVRQLTPEIPVPSRGSALLVFALPD